MPRRSALLWLGVGLATGLSIGCGDDVDEDDAAADAIEAGPDGDLGDGDRPDGDAEPTAGDPCLADRGCGDLACIADREVAGVDRDPLPLVCGTRAEAGDDGEACEQAADCARAICSVAGTCLRACETGRDCDPDQACVAAFARTGTAALQPLRACHRRVATSDDTVVYVDRREVGFGPTEMLPGRAGTMLAALTFEMARPVVVEVRTRATPAETIFDANAVLEGTAPTNGVTITNRVITLLVPNGTRAHAAPEGYEIVLDDARDRAELAVLSRDRDGAEIALDFFIVGATGVSREDTRAIDAAVADANRLFESVPLRVVDVRVHEVVGSLRDELSILEADDDGFVPELETLFRLSMGLDRHSAAIFLVRSIDGALGIAGAVPGPAGMHGGPSSGIALAADRLGGSLGVAMTHELGHFMGLFHTSEAKGLVLDPFDDTAECRLDRDADRNGIVNGGECGMEGGADNLMFWEVVGTRLSVEQGDVLRRSLLTR